MVNNTLCAAFDMGSLTCALYSGESFVLLTGIQFPTLLGIQKAELAQFPVFGCFYLVSWTRFSDQTTIAATKVR